MVCNFIFDCVIVKTPNWLIISCHFCFLQDLSLMRCSLSIFFGFGLRIATFIWWIFTGLNSLHSSKVQECMLNKLFYLCYLSVQWFSCVRGTRTQPLICVGCSVHYWVSCAINKGVFLEIAFVVTLRVVPHFSRWVIFTRARLSLALQSLRKNGGVLVV